MATSKIDFESSLKKLEEIVAKLESGECTLDESIELFEKGMELSNECSKRLEEARQKIITLTDAEESDSND
ncbi:MAG: exodeoxyribonuclease VII small subunit [Ruminococcaceae bacterium]|nr:exodeoxyribonuclease VII small subunit [Oscillospiraceae bacterium]